MRLRSRFGVYELIAFVIGFALMAYELVASRILAPTIGSSTYVWTSVIGVIIAALSFGYATGGYLADRRVKPLDIVWLLSAAASTVLLTVFIAEDTLQVVTSLVGDARLQGLLASILLFLPTSFLLGAISPYLARLRLHAVSNTGTTIASLSALNSLGGIVGTFCTGFIFFSYIGSQETLVLVATLLLAISWLIAPREQLKSRIIISLGLCILALTPLVPNTGAASVTTIDTPSSTYRVFDTVYNGRPLRGLSSGPNGIQSGVYLDGSSDLAFSYIRKMADLIEAAPQKSRILMLGGGAFTLPQHLATTYPNSQIDVVEIDPKLQSIAEQYFSFKNPSNVRVIAGDARAYLNTTDEKYDVVLVDVYSDATVPFSLTTAEYTKTLQQVVAQDGFVAANVIGANTSGCRDILSAVDASYRQQFAASRQYPLVTLDLQSLQNIIFVYSFRELAWLPKADSLRLDLSSNYVLTDNFAPVEHLKQRCESEQA